MDKERNDYSKNITKEAEIRFPIGTKFISVNDNNQIREVAPLNLDGKIYPIHFIHCYGDEIRTPMDIENGKFCSNPLVYKDGVWVETVG